VNRRNFLTRAVVAPLAVRTAAAQGQAGAPRRIAGTKQLFIDDVLIASQRERRWPESADKTGSPARRRSPWRPSRRRLEHGHGGRQRSRCAAKPAR
jgi:hypothetical protein